MRMLNIREVSEQFMMYKITHIKRESNTVNFIQHMYEKNNFMRKEQIEQTKIVHVSADKVPNLVICRYLLDDAAYYQEPK